MYPLHRSESLWSPNHVYSIFLHLRYTGMHQCFLRLEVPVKHYPYVHEACEQKASGARNNIWPMAHQTAVKILRPAQNRIRTKQVYSGVIIALLTQAARMTICFCLNLCGPPRDRRSARHAALSDSGFSIVICVLIPWVVTNLDTLIDLRLKPWVWSNLLSVL